MKKSVKALLTVVCCLVLVVASILGTLAFMTDKEEVVNTFTVGKVDITVNEAKVTEYGETVDGAGRVTENAYKLIPGHTYWKDPTMTVEAGSEPSYVRMILTLSHAMEIDAIFDPYGSDIADLSNMLTGSSEKWRYVGMSTDATANTVSYEFRYNEIVGTVNEGAKKLEPLFTHFVAPTILTSEDLVTLGDDPATPDVDESFAITVVGHAIQAATFVSDDTKSAEDLAWEAFDAQYTANS